MAKKSMKIALGSSVKIQEPIVRSGLKKVDPVYGGESAPHVEQGRLNGSSKVIRDSFTIPGVEYALISQIKKRCMKVGINANKSEVLRAGLAALRDMPDRELAKLFGVLTRVKTGRPAAKK